MVGRFGVTPLGDTDYASTSGVGKFIAVLGDGSSHGGTLVSTNQDGTLVVDHNLQVCVNQCSHSCPIPFHGTTAVAAITAKSYHNGKLIITGGARAGCGAVIQPPDRKIYIE